jgi:osmotically inducible lipoprotein OsmB
MAVIFSLFKSTRFEQTKGTVMTSKKYFAFPLLAIAALSACSGMSEQGKSTAIGAGIGAVGGAVLTGGNAVGTIGGAVVGGVVGHEVAK